MYLDSRIRFTGRDDGKRRHALGVGEFASVRVVCVHASNLTQCVHRYHDALFTAFPERTLEPGNWVKFTDEERAWLAAQPGVREVRVHVPKGHMVLWDSRTAHQVCKARPDRKVPRKRGVIYTCFKPAAFVTPEQYEKHRKAFAGRRVTSHLPYPMKLFAAEPGGRYPDTRKSEDFDLTRIPPPVLTPHGRRLAWLDVYPPCGRLPTSCIPVRDDDDADAALAQLDEVRIPLPSVLRHTKSVIDLTVC